MHLLTKNQRLTGSADKLAQSVMISMVASKITILVNSLFSLVFFIGQNLYIYKEECLSAHYVFGACKR